MTDANLARETQIHDYGIARLQAFVAKSLDLARTCMLAGDTF